jgi:hypothetical protein
MSENSARYGWESDFPTFEKSGAREIRERLHDFIPDASHQQVAAWDQSIPPLQTEVAEILTRNASAARYEAILEYELPMEARRTDVIFLISGAVVVIELKGKERPSQADIDQAAAYGRDLRCYHRDCANLPVHVVLMPMRTSGYGGEASGVHIMGPDVLDDFIACNDRPAVAAPVSVSSFLSADAYRPLPTLVQAARELMKSGSIRAIHRARAATEPALSEITKIIHEAARTKKRHLVLVTGVPGAGKTLVGLQIVHAHFLDDLAVPRANGKTTAPAVFLSGNGPLVEVLQYELKSAGGGGRTFVRGVLDYVRRYSAQPDLVPPEHVLVYDEAQRAFDAEQVKAKHRHIPGFIGGKSEPEHFIEFAERIPEWCVVIGLIGSGQEIHIGEEGGIVQWRHAVEKARKSDQWKIHYPHGVSAVFDDTQVNHENSNVLNLDVELRFHLAREIHTYVEKLLSEGSAGNLSEMAEKFEKEGYHLRITRDFQVAKDYLRERYAEQPEARYGIIASSKDKELISFGVKNDFQSTKNVRKGPWYSEPEGDPEMRSCRNLLDCMTEFGAQGLELDATLLAWGTDYMRQSGLWSNAKARGYQQRSRVKNPFQLRMNAYRVLLTRGRDATIIFIPAIKVLDETYYYLVESGFRSIESNKK